MLKYSKLAAMGAVVFGCLITSASTSAWINPSRTAYLTFSGPVALPGVELRAGTYTFELATPETPSVVRVSSRDRSKVYLMAFTHEVRRPANLRPGEMVSLGEAVRGAATPIRAWFPSESETGREFIYDK